MFVLCDYNFGTKWYINPILFFSWTLPLLVKGFQKGINETDLLQPPKNQGSRTVGEKLEKSWKKEITSYKHPSLWRAFCRIYILNFTSVGLLYFIKELLR